MARVRPRVADAVKWGFPTVKLALHAGLGTIAEENNLYNFLPFIDEWRDASKKGIPLKQGNEGWGAERPWQRVRGLALVGVLLGSLALAGCAVPYLDGNLKEVQAEKYQKPAAPRPAQLIFEFQTKGVLNTQATAYLKAQVVEQVRTSGLFSQLVEAPVPGAGLLSISLNNVPVTDDAFSKGFVTGLTFGLAGTTVTDGYVCTVKYFPEGRAEPIVKAARHALHTTVGAASAPPNATKMDSMEAAVRTMTRQIVSNGLNDLSQDPSFQK